MHENKRVRCVWCSEGKNARKHGVWMNICKNAFITVLLVFNYCYSLTFAHSTAY